MSTPLDDSPDPAGPTPDRQCGRCRRWFPGDTMLHPVARAEWWACPTCRDALFGARTSRTVTPIDDADRATSLREST